MFLYAIALLLLLTLALMGTAYWIANQLLYGRCQPITHTPADHDLAYEDISFQSKDGLTLKGWWIPVESGAENSTQNPVVIILHPWFGNRHGVCTDSQPWPRVFKTNVDLLNIARSFHQADYTVLMFDFRNHGESQHGLGSGGLTEDQDVMGAVDYAFQRVAGNDDRIEPVVGVIGFGLGATAALAAVGREKGGDDVIRVFSGDTEGGSGFLTIPPPTVKRLQFLIAIQPASPGVLIQGFIHQIAGPYGGISKLVVPLVDWICRWRGSYPLSPIYLLRYVQEIHLPILYVQSRSDAWGDCNEVQQLYAATAGPKQIWWIQASLGRLETYTHIGKQIEPILAFAAQPHEKVMIPKEVGEP